MGALATTKRLLSDTSVALSWLDSFFASSKSLHNSRFAAPHELESLLGFSLERTQTSLLLGVNHFDQPLVVRPTSSQRELGNLLVVAPTRRGKGLLAVSQLLTWPHSVIVNDIKGDLYTQTSGYRSTLGRVYVIDPTGIGNRFDPLQGRESEDELFSSATQLLYTPNEGDGAIFTERAAVMLKQMILGARYMGYQPFPFLNHLIRSGLAATVTTLDRISPPIATQFLGLKLADADLTDRFLLSCWGTLTTKMQPLLTECLSRTLAASDFKTEDLMLSKTPITVYLRWRERDFLSLAPLVRLLVGTLIDELSSTYDKARGINCQPVLILADEAGRTPIPSLSDHATTVVGRGVSLWVAVQSIAQLESVYGKARAEILMDNMEHQLYYRPNNPKTADYIEHALGKKSGLAHSKTIRDGAQGSMNLSEQAVPLLTAQDIKRFKDEDILVFHRNLPPFMARRMDFRRHAVLVERGKRGAPNLSILPPLPSFSFDTKETEHVTADNTSGYFVDPDEIGISPDKLLKASLSAARSIIFDKNKKSLTR